jgi:hypothetical protein
LPGWPTGGRRTTANGVVRTARVKLPLVELGPFRNVDFGAFVTEGELDQSLLGMDYLGQFRMEFDGRKAGTAAIVSTVDRFFTPMNSTGCEAALRWS